MVIHKRQNSLVCISNSSSLSVVWGSVNTSFLDYNAQQFVNFKCVCKVNIGQQRYRINVYGLL